MTLKRERFSVADRMWTTT